MALKDIWVDKVDNKDYVEAKDINKIAEAVIDNEDAIKENASNISKKQDKLTEEQLQNIQDVPNKADADYVNNTFANALKGSAIGQSVNLTDVSPIEHNLDVKVKSKNISVVTNYANATGTNNLLVNIETIPMEVGKVYTASWDTKVSDVRCWFTLYQSYRESISQSKNINACDGTRKYYTFKIISKPGGLSGWALQQSNSAIAEECPISNFMLEEGEVATEYTPYMADVSGVSVKKYGANLLPYPYTGGKVEKGITFTDNGDGTITASGTATNDSYFRLHTEYELKKGVSYQLKGCPSGGAYSSYNIYAQSNTDNSTSMRDTGEGATFVGNGEKHRIIIAIVKGTTVKNMIFKPQLSVGNAEYEPYKEPTTYNVNADGTVEGVTSVCPTTTLITDTGAVVDVTYNRDINKAFAELEQKLTQAIVSLGNNI